MFVHTNFGWWLAYYQQAVVWCSLTTADVFLQQQPGDAGRFASLTECQDCSWKCLSPPYKACLLEKWVSRHVCVRGFAVDASKPKKQWAARWALLGAVPLVESAVKSRKVAVSLPVWSLLLSRFPSFQLCFDTDLILKRSVIQLRCVHLPGLSSCPQHHCAVMRGVPLCPFQKRTWEALIKVVMLIKDAFKR